MGSLLRREPKRVLREIKTTDGQRLRVVAYRIPEPSYKGSGCGPRPTLSAHPDDLLEGLFAAAVESLPFCWILDQLEPGTCGLIHQDNLVEVGVNSTAGARLSLLLMEAQREGLAPMLLRATEVRDQTSAETFVAAWRDPERRAAMRETAPKLLTRRDCHADAELAREMRGYGLPLKHKAVVGKDGKPVESKPVSRAREHLRRILDSSSRIAGG